MTNSNKLKIAEHMPAAKQRALSGNSSLVYIIGILISPLVNTFDDTNTINGKYVPVTPGLGKFS